MYRKFSSLYFAGCWFAFAGIWILAIVQWVGIVPVFVDFGKLWILVALFWVTSSGLGQLVMVPHMHFVRDNHPALWREFHYVPGMTEWAEKTFKKDSMMLQKYNSIALIKYAFSRRDRENPDLRLIKCYLRSSVICVYIFHVPAHAGHIVRLNRGFGRALAFGA